MKILFSFVLAATTAASALGAEFAAAVDPLIPKLADPDVPRRYDAQMALQSIAANASKPGHASERAALGTLLAGKITDPTVPQPARAWILRQLEYMGGEEAVEELTRVMKGADAELREAARRALEKNSAASAGDRLRAALEQATEAKWKIGLMNSLAQRRDEQAVPLIARQLNDAAVGAAAAHSLGLLANAAAVDALKAASPNQAIHEALITAANQMVKAGNVAVAIGVFNQLNIPANPAAIRAAAIAGLIRIDPVQAAALVTEALQSNEPRIQQAALTAAAGVKGISGVVAPLLTRLAPGAKVQAIALLDASAERELVLAADDGDASVRAAALEALGRVGSSRIVPLLLAKAAGDLASDRAAAATALARLNAPGASDAITKAASEGNPKARAAAISALADRNEKTALPALLKYAGEPDPGVSKSACGALARMATDDQIDGLIALVLAGKNEADGALQAVASRSAEKSTAVHKVASQANKARGAQLVALLEVLSLLGGDDALAAVTPFTTATEAPVREGAIRALSNWPDEGATKPLLEIAANSATTETLHVLALQGVNRLIKAAEKEPAAVRIATAQAAFKTARRDQEKKMALSSLGSIADRRAGEALQAFLEDPALRNDAAVALLNVAESLRRSDRPNARKFAELVKAAEVSAPITQRADNLLRR